eukprot:38665_1
MNKIQSEKDTESNAIQNKLDKNYTKAIIDVESKANNTQQNKTIIKTEFENEIICHQNDTKNQLSDDYVYIQLESTQIIDGILRDYDKYHEGAFNESKLIECCEKNLDLFFSIINHDYNYILKLSKQT